ncbi:hypothetical protein GF339_05930 [candidate division KSB3 bacterium]|uniref:DNA polymerase helix-hairpin-helix motif domain-containing protein n=1 Tax=candidate division KSB3 bacterium TaxID=2044937 RepID=A0A9D5Q5A4_9BACT|nr:hypothetical protein [candidate division KSB3 bacterium]MBD3324103.1 hypothetical protein [candidate division KSB3 bacterium]
MQQRTNPDIQQFLRMLEDVLSSDDKAHETIVSHFEECADLGIDVLPVDINRSAVRCSLEDATHIRLGLTVLGFAGEPFLEEIVTERREHGRFTSFQNFCERLDLEMLPDAFFARAVEAGAFDAVEGSRARVFAGYASLVQAVRRAKAEATRNQMGLFDALPASAKAEFETFPLPDVEAWTEDEMIEHEQHALGFSFTAYRLQQEHQEEAEEAEDQDAMQEKGTSSAVIENAGEVERESVDASPPYQDEEPPLPPDTFTAEEFEAAFPDAPQPPVQQEPSGLVIRLHVETTTEALLIQLQSCLEAYPGDQRVFLEIADEHQHMQTTLKAHDTYAVTVSADLVAAVEALTGKGTTRLVN